MRRVSRLGESSVIYGATFGALALGLAVCLAIRINHVISQAMNANQKAIMARRAEIAQTRAALDEEERELVIAERVLARLAGDAPPVAPRVRAARNQADMVLDALQVGKLWQDQGELADTVEIMDGVTIKPTSLQPLLSKLKLAGKIMKADGKFALVERAENEASPATAEEAQ
jgi:hypothetical protein